MDCSLAVGLSRPPDTLMFGAPSSLTGHQPVSTKGTGRSANRPMPSANQTPAIRPSPQAEAPVTPRCRSARDLSGQTKSKKSNDKTSKLFCDIRKIAYLCRYNA